MIGRKSDNSELEVEAQPKGFDSYELRLGDIMRGERATLGKSLLDVQRELRIKAAYIAAIENADPDAFDTPGFIAGYVRSYARYLNMDPDMVFATFCKESGFSVAHGMSAQASVVKKAAREDRLGLQPQGDIFAGSGMPFTPARESILARIEPGAIGSMLVLLGLIGGIGFGGYTVLREVQRVQVAPVEQTPQVLAELDPIDAVVTRAATDDSVLGTQPPGVTAPSSEALDRLYRPQALDVPKLVPRDVPIASIDPREVGSFRTSALAGSDALTATPLSNSTETFSDLPAVQGPPAPLVPQVVEEIAAPLVMVATAETWVRVRAADGTTIFETTMQAGDIWEAPLTEEPPTLRTGNSGAVYFAMGDKFYGPVGRSGQVTSNLALSIDGLEEAYPLLDRQSNDGVRVAEALASSLQDPVQAGE